MPEPAPATRATSFDAAWLAARRWFRSKARPLAEVALDDVAPLDADRWLLVLDARFADGGHDRYLVPAVTAPDGSLREPADGDGAWQALVDAMARDRTVDGEAGRFRFHRTGALDARMLDGDPGPERRLSVEQSNTSVRIGDRLMLKVYRLLEAGANPEVEVNRFLTDAGFRHAPALCGWAEYTTRDASATAVMLQELVASRGDGWEWFLGRLASQPDGLAEALAAAAQIGGITADLHAALASRPEEPGFAVATADATARAAWRAGAERQLDAALTLLAGDHHDRLAAVAPAVRARFAAVEAADALPITRIHGDYHLGQLLRTEAGFVVIDFEGEPARPLAERSRPASPLRDVAGMLRSLDYAARTAERDFSGTFAPEPWLADARAAFLSAYGTDGADGGLLAAFEAEKACYEVRYEANNRPDWVWLPIAALERLAA